MEFLDLRNFLIIAAEEDPASEFYSIDELLHSLYPPVVHNGYFCFFHGIIHNGTSLVSEFQEQYDNPESLLIDLFIEKRETLPLYLEGNFALVIGNRESIYLFRDGNGCENLYFSVPGTTGTRLIISNTIREITKQVKPEVNTAILPEYFIKTDLNSGATFFKGIETPAFYEFVKIDRASGLASRALYDDFFLTRDIKSKVRIDEVINECDKLAGDIISHRYSQLNGSFRVINSLSGGTDSTYIQYFLSRHGVDIAWTANFKNGGHDHLYASDVAEFMKLDHTTVHSDTADLIRSLPEAVMLGEKPFVFAGESLLFNMYDTIGKGYNAPVACFDGTGAEGIYGASRILYELRMLRKFRFPAGLVLPFLKPLFPGYYSRYREFYTYTSGTVIPDNFILRYFTDRKVRAEVKSAFGLGDLKNIDSRELSVMRRSGVSLFESVYRFLAFELEYRRVNNIRTQLAKSRGIFLVFPFTDHRLFRFLTGLDTEMKLRKARTKYFMRKAMEKRFPAKFIYRKKIMKNVSVSDEILGNDTVRLWVDEIRARRYPYFNFDYEKVFGSAEYSALAYKLINFHLWHRIFIDADLTP